MTYNDLTIEQFIQCVDVSISPLEKYDKETHLGSIISGKSVEEIEAMDFDESEPIYAKVKSLELSEPTQKVKHHLFINGKLHKALSDVGQFSNSRLLSLLAYNGKENRHKFLAERIALVYTPYFSALNEESCYPDQPQHKLDEMAQAIKKKKVGEVYGAVFFFSKLWNRSSLDIQAYLKLMELRAQEIKAKDRLKKEMSGKPSKSTTAGTSILT